MRGTRGDNRRCYTETETLPAHRAHAAAGARYTRAHCSLGLLFSNLALDEFGHALLPLDDAVGSLKCRLRPATRSSGADNVDSTMSRSRAR
jgi:hypothetical protein